MKKTAIISIFTLTLVLACAFALADTSGDWTYTVSGTEATITAYGGNDTNVIIPSVLDGYTVTKIGQRAFRNNTSLTSVEIPSGVTSIALQAFQGCTALEDVTIPDTIEEILNQAFAGTALTHVKIPANINDIRGNAFPSSVLLMIDEYDSIALASIDGVYDYIEYEGVTGGVKLYTYSSTADSIHVPETIYGLPVVDIDASGSHLVFPNNNKLIVDMTGQVADLLSDNGYILYDVSDLTMGLRKSGGTVYLSEYDGTETSITIPASVQVIDINVFRNKATLTEVSLPNGLTTISSGAFEGTGLTSIELPDTLISIDPSAFDAGVKMIASLNGNVSQLLSDNGYVFYDATDLTMGLRKVSSTDAAGNPVQEIILAEYDGTAASVTVPSSVQVIDINVFRNNATLTEVNLPYGLTTISSGAFQGTGLTSIELPDSLISIDPNAFDAGVKMIASLSGNVSQLLSDNGYVFYDATDLTMGLRKVSSTDASGNLVQEIVLAEYDGTAASVTIPEYVNCMSSYAFNGNNTVQSITVLSSAIAFENQAFYGASALTAIYLPDGISSINGDAFTYGLTYYCGKNSDTAKALGSSGCSFIDPTDPDFLLRWNGTSLWLVAYLGNDTTVTIPGDVQEVGNNVFKNNTTVTSVVFPASLIKIHAGAFLNAAGITGIDLPANLTSIETLAFYNTGITDIVIPDGVTVIRGGEVPSNLNSVYYSDGYDYMSLPAGCMVHTTLGSTASRVLSNLGYTVYKPNDTIYGCRYIDNLLYLVKYNGQEDVITVPEGIEGVAYVFGVYNKMTRVEFPSTLKVIGYEAFKNCSGLTSITIPTTVEEIGYEAFAGSALRSIRLPDNVQRVGYGAFRDCTNLASATFVVSGQNGLNTIGEYAFYNTGLRSVTIPTTTTSIGEYAFSGNGNNPSKLATVTLPANGSLIHVGSYAFNNTAVTSLTIPGTVKTIDSNAFSGCYSLKSATLGEGVETIGYGAFQNDGELQTVTLNSGVKTIREYAFSNCYQLETINIPSGVTSIGEWAFYNDYTLKSITLPNTVTSVGEYAFYYANLSEGITLSSRMTTIKPYTFQYSSLSSIVIPNSVTSIEIYAFEGCQQLTEITLSDKLRTIGSGAFNNCTNLVWLELPGTMTSLNQCMDNCTSAIVVLPDSITYIQGIAFDDVRAVLGSRSNVILKSLDRFGYSDERTFIYTYINEDGLEDYNTLRVVDYIGEATEATLPSDVSVINDKAFYRCRQLKKLILPDTGISSIGTQAFHSGLEVVCTKGSDTYQLVATGEYPVEVDGYPGLYAVAKADGKLYDAAYHGTATEITLPDNIASTFSRGSRYYYYYNSVTGMEEAEYREYYTFPDSTRYIVSSFNSETANTLGSKGYYVTVSGKEDYGYRKNRNQWGEDYYEHDELLFSDYVSLDEWVLAYYYGTSSELTIPSDTHYLSLKEVPATTILKLSTINKQNLSYIGDSVKRTIKIDGYDDYDFGFSAEGAWAEFTSGYSSVGFYLKAYNGSNKTLVIDNNFPVYNIEKTAIPSDVMVYSTFYYSHPDIFDSLDMHVQGLNDYIFRYSRDEGRLYIYSYPAVMNGTIRLDSQIIQRNVGIGNIPTSIKIIYPIDEISTMYGREFLRENFTDRNFYLPDYPEFSLRFLYSTNYYYEDKIILYRYTGSAKEVTLDCYYINSIDENAFPDDVKIYNLIFTGYEGDNRGIEFFINRSFYVPSCPGVEFRYRRGMDGQNSGIYVYRFDKSIKEIELTYLNLVDISEIPSDVKIFIPSSEIYYGIFVDRSCYAVGSPDIELREREYTDPDHWSGYGIFKYNGTASEIDLSSTSPLYYFGLCGIFPNAIPEGVKLLMSPDSLVLYSTEIEFYDVNNKDYKYQYDAFTGGLILKAYEGNSDELVIRSNVTGIDESAIPTSVTKVNLNDWNYTFYANCSAALSTGRFKFFAEMDSTFIQNLRNDWGASTIINLSTKRNPDILYRYENITGYDEFPIRLAGTDGSGSSVTLPGYYGAFTEEIISEYQNWLMQPHDGYYDNGEWHEIEVEPFNPFGKPIHVYPNTATANLLDSYGIPYNVRQTVKSSLPAAMTTIEEEAFMNSSFEEVTIGSKCTTIGARAFANSSELMIIHIPRNVRIIDDTAFEGCSQLKIYCKTGSVAETFASNHGIPYVNE